MALVQKHILLISYVFPPYPGIGGRRWAKFSKYLVEKGYIVHVICSHNPFKEVSLFQSDVQHPNIKIYKLHSLYPAVLIKDVSSFTDKLLYRIALIGLKFLIPGNYFDRGALWKKQLLKKSSELIIKHTISNVIVTGAPFSLLKHSCELKSMFPNIHLIGDLRDPWTWGPGYGMQTLSKKRKSIESNAERNVIKYYDLITVPSEEMKDHLIHNYFSFNHKFILLPHGFDQAEIKVLPKTSSKKTRLIFYGTLYNNLENNFLQLASIINSGGDRITLDIYASSNRYSKYFNSLQLLNKQVKYHKPLPPKVLFNTFSNYDYVFVIQPDFAKDYISTKIYEIIYSKTPIILIAKEGRLSRFIIEQQVGIHILPGQTNEKKSELLELLPQSFFKTPFSIEEYSFERLTEDLINHLK